MAGPNQTPTGGTAPNVFDQSADAYNQALGIAQGYTGLSDMMGQFQNPYQQQVIDNTIADMSRAHDLTQQGINDQAASAGAFGGDRHGIQAGLANSEFLKNVGDFSSEMNRQGYLDQANLAGQDFSQWNTAANALSSLAGQGFDFGNTLNQNQWQMGQEAQDLQQDIMDSTQSQYDYANPLNWLTDIMGGLNSNPLSGNYTGTETSEGGYNPSTGEQIMTGAGMIGGLFGK